MLKKLKDSWKYSSKNDKIEFFAVFIAIAFLIAFLIYVVYSCLYYPLYYPKTLEYKDRPAVVKAVSHYSSSAMIPINSGNNVTVYSPVSSSGDTVTYEDENGKRFSEDFSGNTSLVVGDEVIIAVGYDDGKETEYVKLVKQVK